jgi:hypothetical protein
MFQRIEDKIREVLPASERALIVDNIGLPARLYNLAFSDGSTIGVNDVLPHRGMFPRRQALPHQVCSRCLIDPPAEPQLLFDL